MQGLLFVKFTTTCIRISEAVTRRCSSKEVFLQVLQNSQKNTFGRFSFYYSCRHQGCRSRVFVADFEHVFVYWGKYRITTAVLRITGEPYLPNKSLLKINSQDCVSLLTNCNMPKTFFNLFTNGCF